MLLKEAKFSPLITATNYYNMMVSPESSITRGNAADQCSSDSLFIL